VDTQKLGFTLGQAVIRARDKRLPDISKIVGKVDGDTSKEYLALLMWTATWTVSRTLGQYAEPTLDAMHALLYYAEMIDKTKFETFIHDRYAGYYAAIRDVSEKSEGMGLFHVSQYFLACCHSSGSSVKYEELKIALLLEVEKAGIQLRDGVVEKIRHLYDTKNLPTCPMDIQKITEITLYFAGFGQDVESIVLDFVKEL
jgi:hypothetical protein